jgi:hypothetical protein
MAWFRGDDRSHNNKKLLAVKLAGTGLHWNAVSWSASEEMDGKLPAEVVPSLSAELSPVARKKLCQTMVDNGLWVVIDKGPSGEPLLYEIHDFLEYNPSRADLEEKRERERARLAGKRGTS